MIEVFVNKVKQSVYCSHFRSNACSRLNEIQQIASYLANTEIKTDCLPQ